MMTKVRITFEKQTGGLTQPFFKLEYPQGIELPWRMAHFSRKQCSLSQRIEPETGRQEQIPLRWGADCSSSFDAYGDVRASAPIADV